MQSLGTPGTTVCGVERHRLFNCLFFGSFIAYEVRNPAKAKRAGWWGKGAAGAGALGEDGVPGATSLG